MTARSTLRTISQSGGAADFLNTAEEEAIPIVLNRYGRELHSPPGRPVAIVAARPLDGHGVKAAWCAARWST